MNINQNINKLLYVLKQKGQFYKINSFQFYNEKKDKYSTKYVIYKKEIIEEISTLCVYEEEYEDIIEYKEVYKQEYDCYSKIDLMKYLAEELRGSEADGE